MDIATGADGPVQQGGGGGGDGDYLDPTWLTCQTLIRLSEYPANSVCPSALQARERRCGGSARADPGTSGLSSSTRFLLSKSHTLMVGPVAEHNQYLLGEKAERYAKAGLLEKPGHAHFLFILALVKN